MNYPGQVLIPWRHDQSYRHRMMRDGFTLFEVSISLVIVAFGVISILVLFPVGLTAIHTARYQMYAATRAAEVIEEFVATESSDPALDHEAYNPWDVPMDYRNSAPDLENRVGKPRFGMMPMPLQIAKRLDSDGDEIAAVLGQGGYIYYSHPSDSVGWPESYLRTPKPNDGQKLIYAVVGPAQSNAVYSFPMKAWPYYTSYPSPPVHMLHKDAFIPSVPNDLVRLQVGFGARRPFFYLWENIIPSNLADDDERKVRSAIKTLFNHQQGGLTYGYWPYANARPTSLDACIRYCQAAFWFCRQTLTPTNYQKLVTLQTPLRDFGTLSGDAPWKQVMAVRFLSHATTCLSGWKTLAQLGGETDVPAPAGIIIPPVATTGGVNDIDLPDTDLRVTHFRLITWHQSCLNLANRFAASYPYDWRVPRPVERAIMMDHPLLEHDLFAAPLSGPIYGTAGSPVTGRQWRYLAGTPITGIGVSSSYPGATISPSVWGDQQRFTLAAPFSADQRCRQLVFWSVDWQSYEDCETAPSAPVDASKYGTCSPWSTEPNDYLARLRRVEWVSHHTHTIRNPERSLVFSRSMDGTTTGSNVASSIQRNEMWDRGSSSQAFSVFSGVWGADRNGNQKLDRGPLPRSARLKATFVARFMFYDPRVTVQMR